MAHAGVDRVVLQNAHLYGRLDEYFAEAVRRYPDKFIGLASVDESRADTGVEVSRLRRSVRELGLRGLYYANRGLFLERYRRGFDDPTFDGFWTEVRRLGIPVFWEIQAIPEPTQENLLKEVERLNRWNVERNCTYRQSLEYLTLNLDFLTPSELDLILGGNVLRLFKAF